MRRRVINFVVTYPTPHPYSWMDWKATHESTLGRFPEERIVIHK